MSKKDVTTEARNLIRDPKFLFNTTQKIKELGLVADPRNPLIIFLAGLSVALTLKVSVMLGGDSSTGKSTLINKVLKLFAPEFVVTRASFSRRAFAYGEESLDKKILYVNEYRGGRDAQLLLRILQSDGEIAHEYVTSGKTRVVSRLGSPVVFTTTTEDEILEDDATRFLLIRMNPTPDQNLAVFKAAIAASSDGKEPEINVWQESTRLIIGSYKKRFSYGKFFDYVTSVVPSDKARFCRDWNRALGCIEVVALCRSQADGVQEITFQDYCVAHTIINQAFTASAFDVGENELAVQKTVIELFNNLGRAVKISEIQNALQWSEAVNYKRVRAAAKQKLIQYEPGTEEQNVKRLLPVERNSNGFLPSPADVLRNVKELPDSVEYIDPLTGETRKVTRPSGKKGAR